jgi:hypothetical protein
MSKKVKIAGFNKPVNAKKKLIKPLVREVRSVTEAMRPGERLNEESLEGTADLIRKLAKDGKLGEKDLTKIESFAATAPARKPFEAQLRSDTLQNLITRSQYKDFISRQSGEMKGFRQQQSGLIDLALQRSLGGMDEMLRTMTAESQRSLSTYNRLLDQSMGRLTRSTDRQMAAIARSNQQAEAAIARSQSQIASLPQRPSRTEQISSRIDGVTAGDPFEQIGLQQAPIRVNAAPALTGFSTAQQASRARQMQGLTGFRSNRV